MALNRPGIVARRMGLAGIEVEEVLVADLVSLLRLHAYVAPAIKLDRALATGQTEVALTIKERNAHLDVLEEDQPAGLEQLCAVLRSERAWRMQNGFESRPPVS
jgi:hypothetical protein